MKLDDALKRARSAGLLVRYVHGTGEWLITAPGVRAIRQNARKKEAGRRLTSTLRQAEEGRLPHPAPRRSG